MGGELANLDHQLHEVQSHPKNKPLGTSVSYLTWKSHPDCGWHDSMSRGLGLSQKGKGSQRLAEQATVAAAEGDDLNQSQEPTLTICSPSATYLL